MIKVSIVFIVEITNVAVYVGMASSSNKKPPQRSLAQNWVFCSRN